MLSFLVGGGDESVRLLFTSKYDHHVEVMSFFAVFLTGSFIAIVDTLCCEHAAESMHYQLVDFQISTCKAKVE
ncbi:hypothetical protein UB46_16480 [Burkholderiaceae bacterium 16]|nr:hypothetical protein UB46_16480 [Burkholderiaceae bacterium 16]